VLIDVAHRGKFSGVCGNGMYNCFVLAWVNVRCPSKLLYRYPSSAGRGRANMMKGSREKIKTGRDHSPITVTDKTD